MMGSSGDWLQWGRDHVFGEFVELPPPIKPLGPLQWGRDHVIAELYAGKPGHAPGRALQWGRDHVIAELRSLRAGACAFRGFNGGAGPGSRGWGERRRRGGA